MKVKQLFVWCALLLGAASAMANDATFYTTGNLLVPLQETDISVKKEVLTITLGDNDFADIDVQYEFLNHGDAKVVNMGFEATASYNAGEDRPNPSGRHPFIKDFTVTMNGKELQYSNAVVEAGKLDTPYNGSDTIRYAYAYYFKAHFDKGINRVHHTYRYRVSNGVSRTFIIPYWLTPATRWRGGAIDDFTLRICVPKTAKYFCINEDVFAGAEFVVTEGTGKVRHKDYGEWYGKTIEVTLRDGTVEWHARDFRPTSDMEITSSDAYTFFSEDYKLGTYYDRSNNYVPLPNGEKMDRRIARNLPFASRGYVFKDKKLAKYFSQFWWYMPDPSYVPSTKDFTPREHRLLKGE